MTKFIKEFLKKHAKGNRKRKPVSKKHPYKNLNEIIPSLRKVNPSLSIAMEYDFENKYCRKNTSYHFASGQKKRVDNSKLHGKI